MNHMYSLTVFEQKYIPFGSVLCGKYYLISGKLYMEMAHCSIIFLILLDQNSHSPSNIMQDSFNDGRLCYFPESEIIMILVFI